jgi:dTDP-4-dehydrorhamnose reductase
MQIAWRNGKILNLFYDEFRSPIPASVTAQAVWELAAQRRAGVYHVAGNERLSRVEIGHLVAARRPELSPKIVPCSVKDFNLVPRPEDTTLNCARVQQLLPFPLPGLTAYLRDHAEEPI